MDVHGGRRSRYRHAQLNVGVRDIRMRNLNDSHLEPAVNSTTEPRANQLPVIAPILTAPKVPQVRDTQFIVQRPPVVSQPTDELDTGKSDDSSDAAAPLVDVASTMTRGRVKRHARPILKRKESHAKGGAGEPRKVRRGAIALYGAAAVVLGVGGFLAYRAYTVNRDVETQVRKLQVADGGSGSQSSLPSDEKPKDENYLQNYKVAAALPRILTIKKINVTARVMQVGVDKEGRIDVPTTAYDVAWYNGSSRPGEMGAMVIDGHVQGVGGGAIFTNLNKLVVGDQMTIEKGDGTVLTYAVTAVETIPVDQVNAGKLLVSTDTNKPGLSLITCAGSYNTESDSFDSRTIVYALQQ